VIDVFITFSSTWLLLAFICSHSRLTPAASKIREKNEQKLDSDYFGIISIDYWWTTEIFGIKKYSV
jgi:hypothetical protein